MRKGKSNEKIPKTPKLATQRDVDKLLCVFSMLIVDSQPASLTWIKMWTNNWCFQIS